MNLSTSADTIPEVDVSDLTNLSADISIHYDTCKIQQHFKGVCFKIVHAMKC